MENHDMDDSHRKRMYPTLYSYEEFDLLRVVGLILEPVSVSIDFFDFEYIYKEQRYNFSLWLELE